ncbi:glycosyltransferase family 4 protein [Algoriphagus yeomjeoni]|uniref:glycosyltransferase family 4 protein n=1 Tax=Algoriphagus yeomjeoni TaxID=291403 RepID=UPI003CE578D0
MIERPKTVLLLIARFEFGGIPIQAFLWSKFLKKNGFHPIILAQYTHDPKYLELLNNNDLDHGFLNTSNFNGSKKASLFYFYDLINCLQSYKPDFIFPFNKHLSFHVNLIWRFTSAQKAFFMERNHGIEESISWRDSFMKYIALLNSSGLIFNSQTASLYSRFPNKTIVIKNSYRKVVNNSELDHSTFSFGTEDVVLLHIANIVPQKNYHLLLEAWKLLKKKQPNFKLIVIGSDIKNENQSLIEAFNEYGIHYIGRKSNISAYLNRADICLLSTHYEGCPNVILEYMDAGKLIAASDIPSIREVLDSSNHEFLFDNTSPATFVDKILNICNLSDLDKVKMIERNKEKLQRDYSESNYKQIIHLLNG